MSFYPSQYTDIIHQKYIVPLLIKASRSLANDSLIGNPYPIIEFPTLLAVEIKHARQVTPLLKTEFLQ
jgi:hypothetical protein